MPKTKNVFFLLLCGFFLGSPFCFGQIQGRLDSLEKNLINPYEPDEKIDAILFDVHTSFLIKQGNNLNQEISVSRGFTFGVLKDIRLIKHQISFAPGLLLTIENFKNNADFTNLKKSGTYGIIPDSVNYKTNKQRIIYLEIPLELRYRTKPNLTNRSFKIFPGFKFGYQLAAKQIIKTDISKSGKNIDDLTKFRYGPTMKIGYGNLLFSGFYCLTDLIENKESGVAGIGISFFIL